MSQPKEAETRQQPSLDEIIAAPHCPNHKLPEAELRAAQQSRETVVPRLIEELRHVASAARAGEDFDSSLPLFALFLLAEFKAKEALPALLEVLTLPGELSEEFFGDAITESLPRVFAVLADDQQELIEGIIRDPSIDRWVRWEAAEAFVYWARDSRISRHDAGERMRRLLREAIDNRDEPAATALVCVLDELSYSEAREEMREAIETGVADDDCHDPEWLQSESWEDDERYRLNVKRLEPTEITDTVEGLRDWFSFDERYWQSELAEEAPSLPTMLDDADGYQDAVEEDQPVFGTIRYSDVRVGRNDPCPCGSGKKFKKCCGCRY